MPVRADAELFQVNRVVESDRAGVALSGAQCREFGMSAMETLDVAVNRKAERTTLGLEAPMTLRAVCVAGRSQPDRSSMFHMAGSAIRCKNLISVMKRSVVALQASLVSGMLTKDPCPADVARGALGGQQRVGGRHLPAAVGPVVPAERLPGKPHYCQGRQAHRQQEPPAPERG